MKKYVVAHLPIALSYFGVVFGLYLMRGGWRGGVDFWWSMVWLLLGVVVGVLLLFLDRVVYTYAYPQEQLSQHFYYLWKQKRYGDALSLLYLRRTEQQRLTFRSALFMVIWAPLAFFALTSTMTWFGRGVVMGLMAHILYDAWRLQRIDWRKLNQRLFWHFKRKFNHEEQLVFLWVMTALFGLMTMWM